ncbi:PilW family protein [uncultured Neptuniibacter sp.]|uniref:PilW family protein n=1 Tax=uncultured Neptuniibacter sp. TaxID=502143 RepID=UPI0026023803|nr:prepilin-type N-terminal cleavage/methylation domain-containing protein [uncultured Neptuniibacter sp.]
MLKRQQGLTLIEMMIALVLSTLVMGIVISMFTSSIGGHAQAIRTMRLNQDLRIAMDMMVRDIRRAGYWNGSNPASNPHASAISGNIPVGVFGNCVILSYDLDEDGSAGVEEFFGYRLNGDDLETIALNALASGADCSTPAASSWNDLTDEETVTINSLTFVTYPATAASFAAASNRTITITLDGSSSLDANIRTVLTDEVRVRNEL